MEMAIDFESKFFEALQDSVADVKNDIKGLATEMDKNTRVTNQIKSRVDKLDGKVFGKRPSSLASLFGDKQIVAAFAFALLVFLLILASVLGVKVPTFSL